MGSKYANIFIFDPGHQYEESAIRELYGCKILSYEERLNEEIEKYMRLSRLDGETELSESVLELLRIFARIDGETLSFVWREPYWCIFDENLTYSKVAGKAKKISKLTTAPVIYAANYDDDLFLAGMVIGGKEKFRHVTGEELSEYNLKYKQATPEQLRVLPGKHEEELLTEFSSSKDVFEAQKLFASIIGIPLRQ